MTKEEAINEWVIPAMMTFIVLTQKRNKEWCESVMERKISKRDLERALVLYFNGGSILDKIRTEIERQEKWLLQAGYNAYNVDIAFDAIKHLLAESEVEK